MTENVFLAKALAEKNILKSGITISAKIPVQGFGHISSVSEKTGIVLSIKDSGVIAVFEGNKKQYSPFENLISIEGMDISRFAQAYKIKPKK